MSCSFISYICVTSVLFRVQWPLQEQILHFTSRSYGVEHNCATLWPEVLHARYMKLVDRRHTL